MFRSSLIANAVDVQPEPGPPEIRMRIIFFAEGPSPSACGAKIKNGFREEMAAPLAD